MTEPTTNNIGLIIPNTGDLPGAWGTTAVNTNMAAVDGILAGFQNISLSSATTITLTTPGAGSFTPGAGPNQSQNACLYFSGTQTGNAVISLTMPGIYRIWNQCLYSAYYIRLAPVSGPGSTIGAPNGKICTIFFDGTNVNYVDMPDPGTAYDLHGVATRPAWMFGCSTAPYLIKDGSIYSTSVHPVLGSLLGSTFGGNGITTFGVPDELSRVRLPLDTVGTNRITLPVSGISGVTMGSGGGDQNMQSHSHSVSLGFNDPGHTHNKSTSAGGGSSVTWYGGAASGAAPTDGNVTGITFNPSIGTTGNGGSGNVQPAIVSFLPLIKT